MKALKELWNEVGGPFWAKNSRETLFFVAGIARGNNRAVGWDKFGESAVDDASGVDWILADDPTKPNPAMRVWRNPYTGEVKTATKPFDHIAGHEDITEALAEALRPYLKD